MRVVDWVVSEWHEIVPRALHACLVQYLVRSVVLPRFFHARAVACWHVVSPGRLESCIRSAPAVKCDVSELQSHDMLDLKNEFARPGARDRRGHGRDDRVRPSAGAGATSHVTHL